MLLELISLYLYAYLAGSIPSSYLVGRIAKNIDIREYGSGNVGGTNVLRHVGKWWASSSILFEVFIKGISPIWAGFCRCHGHFVGHSTCTVSNISHNLFDWMVCY